MEEKKKCIKCGRELPLDQFYKHKQMSDGHLNKCIECTKKYVHEWYVIKSKDSSWVEKERARCREKHKRLKYKDAPWNNKTRIINNQESNTSRKLKQMGYDTKGKEAHHWNYNEPNSIFLISRKAHKRIHQYIIVNYDDNFCYTKDGEKLDTIDKTKTYLKHILNKYGIDDELNVINLN